jgi:hypothetical protein
MIANGNFVFFAEMEGCKLQKKISGAKMAGRCELTQGFL